VLLPLFVVLALLASLGPALLITALKVKYRDFRYIIAFLVQFGLYVSPVGLSSAVVPQHKPRGGCDRRLPLVPIGRREPALSARFRPEP
jgi:ABC-type polysaccharide/polyol phosphate export permease